MDRKLMEILARAISDGDIDELAPHLAPRCDYASDCSNVHISSAKKIVERMKRVYEYLSENTKDTCSLVHLNQIADLPQVETLIGAHKNARLMEWGVKVCQFDDQNPIAIAIATVNKKGKICKIKLSNDKDVFRVKFFREIEKEDSPFDLPSTVTPITPHDLAVRELRAAFSGQNLDKDSTTDDGRYYIWRQGDLFIKEFLKNNGYQLEESRIYEDCIGYRCNRRGLKYVLYLFSYGNRANVYLDGEYCEKLKDYDFSDGRTVLMLFLRVRRFLCGDDVVYKIFRSGDGDLTNVELWKLSEVSGKPIIQYYTREEMIHRVYELMYAFNHDSLEAYDCIVCEDNHQFFRYDDPENHEHEGFYESLKQLHDRYGDMKLGYVRFNDVVYSAVPYIENYGYLWFTVNSANKIYKIHSYSFADEDRFVEDFIYTDEKEDPGMYSNYPHILEVSPLAPVKTERFALKLVFDSGEVKKYVLPIAPEDESIATVDYAKREFTDEIWLSAKLVEGKINACVGYPDINQAVVFDNGHYISSYVCYEKSMPYFEPTLCNETVYEDDKIRLNKLWKWNAHSVYEDEETGLMKVLLYGNAFNYNGVSTIGTSDGKRLTSLDFDYLSDFSEGMACVGISGRGYGYIDTTGQIVIPAIYDDANEFKNGRARVKLNDKWLYVDKSGNETELYKVWDRDHLECKYQEIGEISDGLCRVSALKLRHMDLAYYSDYEHLAGTWGYVDATGKEVIPPQYIYANDFENGIAIVCKGEWTIDTKWDNKCNTGKYWTEEELWGAIDKNGNTIIPFIFDEIQHFDGTSDAFMVHYGGWEKGKWGVISKTGEWLADPIYDDIAYDYKDGLFAFEKSENYDEEEMRLGVYDINQRRVVLEPQFYEVNFLGDGCLKVEVFDEKLGRRIEKIIDLTGKELFPSVYTSIYCWKDPYEVVIYDENGSKHGLVDRAGNIILPCKYNVPWGGISYKNKLIVALDGEKESLIDFDENLIIPAGKYHKIYGLDNQLLTVREGDKDNYKEGLVSRDGTVVVPPKYLGISWFGDNRILCRGDNECEMFELTMLRRK